MNKRVLIIVENLPVPFDRRVWKEACALHDEGYQVTILCPRAKGYMDRHVILNGINIYRYPMSREGNGLLSYLWEYGWALFWQIAYTWRIYIDTGFDIIQGCNPPDNIFLVALPFKLFGVKYIFDHHDASPELYYAKYQRKDLLYLLLIIMEKMTYYFSNAVIATNESYKELAVKRGKVDSHAVFIVRNGPDLASFKRVAPKPALKYGKNHLVGYVGTMSHQEGLDILLDVVQHIKNQQRRDVHLTCVGGGPALAHLCQLVKDRDLEDMINFTGRVSDQELLEVLSTADVCVNPDKPCKMNDISTMIKIVEYMALGKPIVQFDLKEGRFTAQEASLYSSTEDPVSDFATKILWLLDHPEERRRMSDFALKRVEQKLAWKYSIDNLLLAYKHVYSLQARTPDRKFGEPRSAPSIATEPSHSISCKSGRSIVQHYRCPECYADLVPGHEYLQGLNWGVFTPYFQSVCGSGPSRSAVGKENATQLLRKAEEVIQDLRYERYASHRRNNILRSRIAALYYFSRPILPTAIRKYIQRVYLSRWKKLTIPQWPVDTTVDHLLAQLLLGMLKSDVRTKRIPFIWFWPEGASSCAIMTHDVETEVGLKHCSHLMDIDAAFGVPASFQIVPEDRYHVSPSFIEEIKKRGFEVNVQDLNHDGLLFRNEQEFGRRAIRINAYADKFGARGFRSAVLYRNHEWLNALAFEYDMSVPNVAHLDPQRGGCCTVLPYFIDDVLELPVTTTQDYSLFHILNHYSLDLWKRQIDLIRQKNGLISFITHPDYVIDSAAIFVYHVLLSYLVKLRDDDGVWITTPGQVNDWWRQRAQLQIVEDGEGWRIVGPGSERARIAYAEEQAGQLVFSVQGQELCAQENNYIEVGVNPQSIRGRSNNFYSARGETSSRPSPRRREQGGVVNTSERRSTLLKGQPQLEIHEPYVLIDPP